MMAHTLKAYAQEYATLWDAMEITRDQSIIEQTAATIIAFRSQYEQVEAATNVPWYVVGIVDMREGGGKCCTHLHNGDSLKAQTVNVPANRPKGNGPFTWHESACDALRFKKFDKIREWTVEQMAFVFERYNGFGYRSKSINIPSPYLWGGTNHQARGKYIADHVFSKEIMDPQIGCMPLLKVIADKCDIELVSQFGAVPTTAPTPASNRKAEPKPLGTIIKENKELVVFALGGGGAAAKKGSDAISTPAPEPPQPTPKIDPKAAIQKGKETRELVEQAKDLGIFARDFGKWVASGDGMFISAGILAAGAAAWWWSKR